MSAPQVIADGAAQLGTAAHLDALVGQLAVHTPPEQVEGQERYSVFLMVPPTLQCRTLLSPLQA